MTITIRAIDPASEIEIGLVAERMRATLVEVLGEERGTAMYGLDWLRDRVRFHLAEERAVFLAEREGAIVGHTIVRVEEDERGRFGLFSTTYVIPGERRAGVARVLLDRGERWMRELGLARAATYTSDANAKLIRLYEERGYAIVHRTSEMVVLERRDLDGRARAPGR